MYVLVKHAKLHRTSFIKQKYLTKIQGTLINLMNEFHHKLLLANFCQTFDEGVQKNLDCSNFRYFQPLQWNLYLVQIRYCTKL